MSEAESYSPPYPFPSRGYADVDDLQPHPKNREIYTDRENGELRDRMERHGFKETHRVLICQDGTILSGHRRVSVAKEVGIDRIPVEVVDIDPGSDEALLELLTANDYRDKTPAEKVNEAEAWEEIEREEAKDRQGARTDIRSDLDESGRSDERAAEKVGLGKTSYRKGKTVKEKAEAGDETAQEEWGKLESGEQSIHGAYSAIKEAEREREEEPETTTPELPDETYRALVIDPPWPVEKIGRDERPDQGKYLDYPTMDMSDIIDLPVPDLAADTGAHIYLWTTQKHLPDALKCLDEWGARYECLMTWVKPTGVAPFSWQYNTEHVLFARYGDGLEIDNQGLQLSFEGGVDEHSQKPTTFYDRVRKASPLPRLEMFARDSRDGFEVWGDEVNND